MAGTSQSLERRWGCCGLGLVVAIDPSRPVIALVGAEEHVLKRVVARRASWARHYREIPSREKRSYMKRFPERYRRLLQYLTVSRVCFTIDCVDRALRALNPELVILDDKLARELVVNTRVLLESSARSKGHLYLLVILADNLANYARTQLHENPSKAIARLRELEK